MITYENGLFLLKNEEISLLLGLTKHGWLEQLHFGAPVELADADALRVTPGLGWGSSVLLDSTDTESCMDAIPLAWSGSGRGDYRESPLQILDHATDLRYAGHRILEGGVKMDSVLPQAHGAEETLEITLTQPGMELKLYFSLFGGVLTRRCVLVNTGSEPLRVHKLMSTMMDLPGDLQMTTFNGGWIAEMRPQKSAVGQTKVVNESTTGFSSHRHNPGFMLHEADTTEESGVVYGFNLIYSGNHYASAQRSLQGLTRVMQGISPDHFERILAPGEGFQTPEAVLSWSEEGFGGLSRRMHRFVNRHIIPSYWQGRERPVLYNDWEGCMFDFDQRRLLSLARKAKDLGCELFVLDDGWFGQRNHDRAGLGDYNVNRKKLPQGLEGLSRNLKDMGLQFGLWFEPESVNPDSDLYRAHPDWALTDEFQPVLGRNQLLLDLTKQEVRDYIVENVTRILDHTGISYVKWDMNRHSIALGARAHDYILGLYDVLERILAPRPEVLLESCSSGGNRFDLGMLCYGPQVWCSDDTDPIERIGIQTSLSYLYPQSTFGAHVSAAPHAQTLRSTPMTTRGNVAFFGCLGYELDLNHLLPIEVQQIKDQISCYKRNRALFQFGTFYRLENGWEVSDGSRAIATVFHGQLSAAPGYERLRLKGLDREKRYRFCSVSQGLRVGQFGNLVNHVSPVRLNPNGAVLRTADRFYAMPDGGQSFSASGRAFRAGVQLLPLFRGTGYDAKQRTQLDYGSDLYIIEEE